MARGLSVEEKLSGYSKKSVRHVLFPSVRTIEHEEMFFDIYIYTYF